MNDAKRRRTQRWTLAPLAMALMMGTTGCLPGNTAGSTGGLTPPNPAALAGGLDNLTQHSSGNLGLNPEASTPLTEMFEDDGPGQVVDLYPGYDGKTQSWNGRPQPWRQGLGGVETNQDQLVMGPPAPGQPRCHTVPGIGNVVCPNS